MPDALPAAGPSAQPQAQQPPMGSSPATGPTPNKGYEAAGLQRLGLVIKQLEALVPLLGSGSEPGAAVLKALNSLAKFVPSGAVTPGAERTNIDRMAMQNAQNNQAMAQMRQGQSPAQQMQPRAA